MGKAGVEERSDQTLCPADFTPITTEGVHKPCGEKLKRILQNKNCWHERISMWSLPDAQSSRTYCGSSEGTYSES